MILHEWCFVSNFFMKATIYIKHEKWCFPMQVDVYSGVHVGYF